MDMSSGIGEMEKKKKIFGLFELIKIKKKFSIPYNS
jgi:hypothetical protein